MDDPVRDRVTFRLSRSMKKEIDELVDDGTYINRAEAIRGAIRMLLRKHRLDDRQYTKNIIEIPAEGGDIDD